MFYLTGTATDEVAAADARTSNAPNEQDLQSTIAPQLTTTGADPANQPEIPQDEADPITDLPFIEDWPSNDTISHLVDYDPMIVEEGLMIIENLRTIVTSFIYQSGISGPIYSKLTSNLKFRRMQPWIGRLLNPLVH